MKPIPIIITEETDNLKYGDIFTITPDKMAKNWRMVENKVFIAIPKIQKPIYNPLLEFPK